MIGYWSSVRRFVENGIKQNCSIFNNEINNLSFLSNTSYKKSNNENDDEKISTKSSIEDEEVMKTEKDTINIKNNEKEKV